MTTAKKATPSAGWTDAQIEALKAGYNGDNSADALAALVAGKTAAMARSKLVNLGLYIKADPATKAADGKPAKSNKIQLVNAIEVLLSQPVDSLNTLEKASKPQLEALAAALAKANNKFHAEQGIREPEPETCIVNAEGDEVQTSGM